MAKRANKREEAANIKEIYKSLSKVDRNIELPPSLKGDALLKLLDDVPEKKAPGKEIKFSPAIFSWKSGITYAAALVLIVALSASLSRLNPSNYTENPTGVENSIPVETPSVNPQDDNVSTVEPQEDPAHQVEESVPETPVSKPPESAPQEGESASSGEDAPGEATSTAPEEPGGVGGSGESIALGKDELYTYTYRLNDQSDPLKQGAPLTLNIMHTNSEVLAFEIDITDLTTIDRHYIQSGIVTLVGGYTGGGVGVCSYNINELGNPVNLGSHHQAGRLLDAYLNKNAVSNKNILSLATFLEDGSGASGEVVKLAGSTGSAICEVSLINTQSMETVTKAFQGASTDVQLGKLNAYLKYEGEVDDAHPDGQYVAHLRIDGTEMELKEE